MLSTWFDASSPSQAAQPLMEGPRRLAGGAGASPLRLVSPLPTAVAARLRPAHRIPQAQPPVPFIGRWGRVDTRAWVRRLVAERLAASRFSGAHFFSLKLQAHQERGSLEQVLRRRFPRRREVLGLQPDPPLVVRLDRRTTAAVIASLHFSRCTGAFDLGLVTTHQDLPIEKLLDPTAIAGTRRAGPGRAGRRAGNEHFHG
jgi:hypothetical protein